MGLTREQYDRLVDFVGEHVVYRNKATKSSRSRREAYFTFGRLRSLDGKPTSLGGYAVFKLVGNYSARARGGIAWRWQLVGDVLSFRDAVSLLNRSVGYDAFDVPPL